MINKKFEAYKITRTIKQSGQRYVVHRRCKNCYGEPGDEEFVVGFFDGLYYDNTTQVRSTMGSGLRSVDKNVVYRIRKESRILCLYEHLQRLNIHADDYIYINCKKFYIREIKDIEEWGIIADIVLEEEIENVVQA